jgi:hypothetical protein
LLKLNGFTCANTVSATIIVTGIVTVSPVVFKTICPVNVPAVSPNPGSFVMFTATLAVEPKVAVAVPLAAAMLSHPPPSAVLTVDVHASEPTPAFRIPNNCAGGTPALVCIVNVNPPATWSKYVSVVACITMLTGIVSVAVPLFALTTIDPVYVPAASVTTGFAFTWIAVGVEVQQPNELGVIVSHVPPVTAVAVAPKAKFAPVLVIEIICGKGSFPPNVLLKLKAGTGANACPQPLAGNATSNAINPKIHQPKRFVSAVVAIPSLFPAQNPISISRSPRQARAQKCKRSRYRSIAQKSRQSYQQPGIFVAFSFLLSICCCLYPGTTT